MGLFHALWANSVADFLSGPDLCFVLIRPDGTRILVVIQCKDWSKQLRADDVYKALDKLAPKGWWKATTDPETNKEDLRRLFPPLDKTISRQLRDLNPTSPSEHLKGANAACVATGNQAAHESSIPIAAQEDGQVRFYSAVIWLPLNPDLIHLNRLSRETSRLLQFCESLLLSICRRLWTRSALVHYPMRS